MIQVLYRRLKQTVLESQTNRPNKKTYPKSDMGIQQDIHYREYQIINDRSDD
jgi:hypothetical protein